MQQRYKFGVIVMTALPPTIGHMALIEFASHFMWTHNDGRMNAAPLFVIVNERSFEPCVSDWPHTSRASMIREELRKRYVGDHVIVVSDMCDEAPQNPSEHPQFWDWWRDRITGIIQKYRDNEDFLPLEDDGYLFASEQYGETLAQALGLHFVPYDMSRSIVPCRATTVRADVFEHWDKLLDSTKRLFHRCVTIFGAESCGKTTIANRLQRELVGHWGQPLVRSLPEWARPYLEATGAELTPKKMDDIVRGQYALMYSHRNAWRDVPFIVQDTDLLSTIGYYRIMGWEPPVEVEELFHRTSSRLYIVMPSTIPFVEDQLRYGGNKRQSTDQFWIDLLEEFEQNYHVVTSTDRELQYQEVKSVLLDHVAEQTRDLTNFVRT